MAKKRKASTKVAARSRAGEITDKEWGKIHAKAWLDPEFRRLLETDPTAAIKCYGLEIGKSFNKIVILRPRPTGITSKDQLEQVNPFPPTCC
jgi:hypothetical protein